MLRKGRDLLKVLWVSRKGDGMTGKDAKEGRGECLSKVTRSLKGLVRIEGGEERRGESQECFVLKGRSWSSRGFRLSYQLQLGHSFGLEDE